MQDDKEHVDTLSIATLKTGSLLWNVNDHSLLPLSGKGRDTLDLQICRCSDK